MAKEDTKTYVLTRAIHGGKGLPKGAQVELTEEQAKSDFYRNRIQGGLTVATEPEEPETKGKTLTPPKS